MLSPLVPMSAGDTSNYYGFGVMIKPHSTLGKIVTHSGGWPGYATWVSWLPEKEATIILLSNNGTNGGLIDAGIQSILADEPLIMPYAHKEVSIDTTLLNNYVGNYFSFMNLNFIKRDGKLFRHRAGTADIELKPESNNKFFYADGTDRQIEFELDAEGKVVKAWFINSGQKGELKKVN